MCVCAVRIRCVKIRESLGEWHNLQCVSLYWYDVCCTRCEMLVVFSVTVYPGLRGDLLHHRYSTQHLLMAVPTVRWIN